MIELSAAIVYHESHDLRCRLKAYIPSDALAAGGTENASTDNVSSTMDGIRKYGKRYILRSL